MAASGASRRRSSLGCDAALRSLLEPPTNGWRLLHLIPCFHHHRPRSTHTESMPPSYPHVPIEGTGGARFDQFGAWELQAARTANRVGERMIDRSRKHACPVQSTPCARANHMTLHVPRLTYHAFIPCLSPQARGHIAGTDGGTVQSQPPIQVPRHRAIIPSASSEALPRRSLRRLVNPGAERAGHHQEGEDMVFGRL